MKKQLLWSWSGLTALLAVTSLAGCGGGGNSGPTNNGGGTGGQGNGYILAPSTYLLKANDSTQIVSQSGTSLTLNKPVDLKRGAVILSQAGEGTFVKVVSARKTDTTTVVETEPAALAEAFTKLSLPSQMPWNEGVAGPIKSLDAAIDATWVTGSNQNEKDIIRLKFGDNATGNIRQSQAVINGIGVRGSVDFDANPVYNPVVEPGPDGKGVLKSLEIGFKPVFSGSLQLQRIHSGSFSIPSKPYVDQDLRSFLLGPLVVTPHITIKSSVDGQANYAFGAGIGCNSSATGLLKFQNNTIEPILLGTGKSSVEVTGAKGTFGFDARLIEVTVTFNVLRVGGPSIGAYVGSSGDGKIVIKSADKNVIEANADSGLFATIGLKGSNALKKFFEGAFNFLNAGELPSVEKKFQLLGPHFHAEFDIDGSELLVGDNGPDADDVFQVTVDGVVVGSTLKGQTNKFPISDISPGNHSLRITCIEDGGGVGTLGISLFDGITFADKTTTYSGELYAGQSVDFTIVAPQEPQPSVRAQSLRRNTTSKRDR